jgi:hypothetical protein
MSVVVLSNHSSFLKPSFSTRRMAIADLPENRHDQQAFLVPMKRVGSLRCSSQVSGNPYQEDVLQSDEEAQAKPTEFTRWQVMLPVVTAVMSAFDPNLSLDRVSEMKNFSARTVRRI